MEWNRKEIFRYLGIRSEPDERTAKIVEEMLPLLEAAAAPKHLYRIFPVFVNGQQSIDFTCFQAESRNLAKNLTGCEQAVLFAATLGAGVDRLIARYNRLEMSRAIILQAAAAAMIESYCDEACDLIKEEAALSGLYSRPRFSPGYGDFRLDHQADFIRILECPKKIGLTLTNSLMLMPSKSVTAVMGLSNREIGCHKSGCESCGQQNCLYRRAE